MPEFSPKDFIAYVRQHLTGDEKGEAAEFLEHLFRAFGHDGLKEAGASREARIPKKGGGKGKKYGDLLLPDRVLIEMKSRGEKLEKHYDQLFDYWTHIVPHRPPYAILCNFDEFWIYDFNTQLFDPVDKIRLEELPERTEAFAFLLPRQQRPLFNNNRVEVTRRAADQLAALFRSLVSRGESRERAQRFILQLLVGLVSEDIGLLPGQILTRLVRECREKGESAYDLIGGLFHQMNREESARGGRYVGVDYFNGGLFATIEPLDLTQNELALLDTAADQNWALVKPEIFGTLFQSSMDEKERHAFGAHFTSEFDIQKVVGPTIVRPWREKMAAAWDRVGKLKTVLKQLRLYRVLDPACGSGNFLYVAYRELKRLEREILVRLSEISKGEPLESAVSIHQFHGIDIQPFAVELAKVTLMLAKEQEVRESKKMQETHDLLVFEKPLPLDNLDDNILCADALFTEWPKSDAIIGNPPYLDARKMTLEYGAEYTKKLRKKYPDIPGRADLCVFWFRRAHDELGIEGRAGLVGTNSVRQNYSREGGLDHIVGTGGTITNAISTQVWSGDAAVHVSIVNWLKGEDPQPKHLTFQCGDSVDSPWETHELPTINSALSTSIDVSGAKHLTANTIPKVCLEGQQPGHTGFCINAAERSAILASDPTSSAVLHPLLNGTDLLTASYIVDPCWVIDFGGADLFEAMRHPGAFQHVKSGVLELWTLNAEKEKERTGKTTGEHQNRLKTWWQLKRRRGELIEGINRLPRYFVCSAVTKRPIFEFLSSSVRPSNALKAFLFADDYSFGIIQSFIHFEWFQARCSTLESRFRYTPDSVFDTFPWPQLTRSSSAVRRAIVVESGANKPPSSVGASYPDVAPDGAESNPTTGYYKDSAPDGAPLNRSAIAKINAVAEAGCEIRRIRTEALKNMKGGLRALYRTLELPGANPLKDAHAALDNAVLAARIERGEPVTPPGIPAGFPNPETVITEACFQPPSL